MIGMKLAKQLKDKAVESARSAAFEQRVQKAAEEDEMRKAYREERLKLAKKKGVEKARKGSYFERAGRAIATNLAKKRQENKKRYDLTETKHKIEFP